MQTVLDLSYQLDDVNYGAENFVHADMDLETFTRRQDEAGEGFLELMVKQMLNGLTNPPKAVEGAQPPSFLEIMDAFNAPDRARRLKLLFAQQLSQADDMLQQLTGDQPSVIVDERNATAFKVLDGRLAGGEKHLALFYGAAHLKGMSKLLEQRGFHKVGQPEWLTAWDMTLDGSARQEMRDRLRQSIVADAEKDGAKPAAGSGQGRRPGGRRPRRHPPRDARDAQRVGRAPQGERRPARAGANPPRAKRRPPRPRRQELVARRINRLFDEPRAGDLASNAWTESRPPHQPFVR